MAVDSDKNFHDWILPDFEDEQLAEQEADLFGRPANWYQNQQQQESEPENAAEPKEEGPKPLTLEDIESIRASAYEDGFSEGKEAGFIKGLEEGKLKGLAEGHEQGLAQGLEQGLSEGQVKIEAQTLHWQQLVCRLHRPLEKLDNSVEFQLIKLATTLAEQIVRCEVTVNPQVVLQALKQAVEALPVNEQTIVISLNPDDLVFVQNAFSQDECEKRGWDLRAEPTLLRGDCQVQTKVSSIDYTFSTRIEQVLKHFLKENYQNTVEVSNDGEINNDQPLNYQMQTEEDLQALSDSDSTSALKNAQDPDTKTVDSPESAEKDEVIEPPESPEPAKS